MHDWCILLTYFCLLQQEETALALEVEGNNSLMHKPAAISGCLKIIKVKFDEIDDRVCKVLKFLSILGTEIIIQRTTDGWRYCKLTCESSCY
jgi:hypothetical protein